jgi:hypothetical protein
VIKVVVKSDFKGEVRKRKGEKWVGLISRI